MQVRALVEAAVEVQRAGATPVVQVMIPLVVAVDELAHAAEAAREVAAEVLRELGAELQIRVGTMIETPRAALVAAGIAPVVDFCSFGTNDLTQMTFAFSRDDVEARLLPRYVAAGLLDHDPFERIDVDGVGELVRRAVADGRGADPTVEFGVCGEHGGEPASIAFFREAGLDYVSCSPFRLPVARLAAAQATLDGGG